ncbi:MAG TPA: amidohydrolase, partial [Microlunatus sp.]|nr:amidohydrolase [Microlunatus sp.]
MTPGRSDATAVLVGDGRISAVGRDELDSAVGNDTTRVDLNGRLVTPAFVDAHVHTVQTGLLQLGLDLHG